jgi:hypothetical protein
MEACEVAIDVAGAGGALAEATIARLVRDARSLDLLEGTGDIQRLNVAKAMLTSRIKQDRPRVRKSVAAEAEKAWVAQPQA